MNELPTVLGVTPFVPIVILCYFVGAGFKAIGNERLDKFIPEIVAVFGGAITAVLFNTISGYIPASNWFDAFILGMVSGAVAVFCNQVYKQFSGVVEPGVLIAINDDKADDDDENEGEDVDEFEETLEEGESK